MIVQLNGHKTEDFCPKKTEHTCYQHSGKGMLKYFK